MLEPSSYSSRTANQVNTKFGLHDKHFATLANFNDFHQILEWSGGLDHLINLDIHPELGHLASTVLDFFIKVPTLGFTDPAFDYDMRPWFAVPIGLNGFGSTVAQPWSSLAKNIIGVDLLGNQYPLLLNEKHQIDYEAIAASQQGEKLFTTLKALIYVYSPQQLIAGEGLTPLSNAQALKNKCVLMPPQHAHKDYTIEVGLMSHEGVEQSRVVQIERLPLSDYLHVNNFSIELASNSNHNLLDIFIDAQTRKDVALNQYMMSLTLPRSGINLQSITSPAMVVEPMGDDFRLTKVFGLSETALRSVLTTLIPGTHLTQAFENSQTDLDDSVFNDFSMPKALDLLYATVIDSVINTSIPLMALNSMFDVEHFPDAVQSLPMEDWSIADNHVFAELLHGWQGNSEHAVEDFADKLDGMLTLEKFYPQWHVAFATEDDFDHESFKAQLYFEPWDHSQHVTPLSYIAQKDHFEKLDSTYDYGNFMERDDALVQAHNDVGQIFT